MNFAQNKRTEAGTGAFTEFRTISLSYIEFYPFLSNGTLYDILVFFLNFIFKIFSFLKIRFEDFTKKHRWYGYLWSPAFTAYIHSNKLSLLKTGVYTPEALLEEEAKLNEELSSLQEEEQVSDIAMQETIKEIQILSELIKSLMSQYEVATPKEKETIIRIIFSELNVSQNVLNYKCKRGFECFENRFVPLGGELLSFARTYFEQKES